MSKVLLMSSLLPTQIIEGLQAEDEEKKLGEGVMCAVATYMINSLLRAINTLEKGGTDDANPGDGGCQNRALVNRRLKQIDLKAECESLKKSGEAIKKLLNNRQGNDKPKKCSSSTFIREQFGGLMISQEMEFLVHCHVSAVLRTPYETLSNGVVMTKSDMSKLSKLSNGIGKLDACKRHKIVEENQKTLSILSLVYLREEAAQISTLGNEEKELMILMLSEEHTHVYTPDPIYESKTFGCLFYEVKTVLIRLREEEALVALKGVRSFHLLLQPKSCGAEFEVLPDEACALLSTTESVVIFEAVVNVDKQKMEELLIEHGFSNIVLAQAANEAPYEPKSTLEDIKVDKALCEINTFKERSLKIGHAFQLDHVYLDTLKNLRGKK